MEMYKNRVNDIQKRTEWKTKLSSLTFQFPQEKLHFLTILYKDNNSNIQNTLYCKSTDEQAFLHANSKHPRSLKNNILYSQVLRLKAICSTTTEYNKNCASIKQRFLDRQK